MKNLERHKYKHCQKIEEQIYPEGFWQFRQCSSFEEYAETDDYKVYIWDTGYLFIAITEVIDLASLVPLTIKQLRQLVSYMKEFYGDRKFCINARSNTSWKLLQYLEKKDIITINSKDSYTWNDELFYELCVNFNT